MFKKPLDDLKTSAPLRNSDRRKLKQRALHDFGLSEAQSDLGDLIVPDGLQSVKFTAHNGEPGVCSIISLIYQKTYTYIQVAYLSSDGEPLWFTLGKGNNDLIPTGEHAPLLSF